VTANDAEMARFTYGVTVGLNSVVAGIVNMVDAIRSLPPTSRTSSSRTWGPANSDHPGWQSRMIIWRDAGDPAQLDYEIAFHQAGAADTEWPRFLTGWFRAGQTARRGRGHF